MRTLHRYLAETLSMAAASVVVSTTAFAGGSYFDRVATLPVYQTLADGTDKKTETVAEIITATQDGRTLIFTDSAGKSLVFVDSTNPANPLTIGRAGLEGEPTSVSAGATYALVAVNTSESYVKPSGHLAVVDLQTRTVKATCDVQGQPDSVAISPDGNYVAIAIENERDEDLNDGAIPQLPAGHLAVFDLDDSGMPQNCNSVRNIDLTGLAKVAPQDPEPEFVAINTKNVAVVTLQENNHIALVDLPSGKIVADFSAGTSSAMHIPTAKTKLSDGTGSISDMAREPDAVAWIDDQRFVTANEGDYKGGSRGFTIFSAEGDVLFDSGAQIEHLAMAHGHYPAKRASKKGAEPEGVAVGTFGGERLIFVGSERANFVAVYRDTGGAPTFVQFLPTHVKPEGLLALSERDLFVVANEEDSVEDGVRAALGIYRFGARSPSYPMVISGQDPKTGAPIGWGALSGLAADPDRPNVVYAVSDSFYAKARIFTMDVSNEPAQIVSAVDLKGGTAELYDLEGIAVRKQGGFWLASEGHPGKKMQHFLLQVKADGSIEKEITLPKELVANAQRFSLEGVSEYDVDGQNKVVVAFQREWKDDPKGLVKLGIYDPDADSWNFVHYPLDKPKSPAGGWVGLSEITHIGGGQFAILERDNKGGPDAAIKQVTMVSLAEVKPAPLGSKLPVLKKRLVKDLMPAMTATNGWTADKVEGFTITAGGRILIVTDNDGVDDATGETLMIDLGPAQRLM